MFSKDTLRFFLFITISALFVGLFLTSTDFIKTPFNDWKDIAVLFTQWLVVFFATWSFVYVLAVNKYIFTIFFPLMVFIGSILAYFRYTMNAVFTTMILDATLDNDKQTSLDLITPGLIVFVLFMLVGSVCFIIYRHKRITVKKPLLQFAVAACFFLLIINIPRLQRPLSERIPFNMYFITERYLSEKKVIMSDRPSLSKGTECSANDSLIVVFVLGESLRTDHLGFNGYSRNTTPNLSKEDIISFTDIYCEQTYTNISVPHILTMADSLTPDKAFQERSFIDVFKACNFYTSWLANQESADTYVYFMHECDFLQYVNIEKSPYVFDKWVDESLIPYFDKLLASEKDKQLVIMHTIGSHWYYNSHYTDDFQVFRPVTNSRIISSCTSDELINSYDNTVLYTDFFLHTVIEKLRDKNAILIYLSDHGESLGENNVWLHAADSPPIHNPACFVWMSPTYKTNNADKYEIASANRLKHYRTDFLFHSILDAAGIKNPHMDYRLSIFR